jgi:hypothetical protein
LLTSLKATNPFQAFAEALNKMNGQVLGLVKAVDELTKRVTVLDKKVSVLDRRVSVLDKRVSVLDKRVTVLEGEK